jgi:hypothetical protein
MLGVRRLSGGPNRQVGKRFVHYVWYKLDILDIFSKYSL